MPRSNEELIRAIKAANACLEAGEGVDLLYYMEMIDGETDEYHIIKEIINVQK